MYIYTCLHVYIHIYIVGVCVCVCAYTSIYVRRYLCTNIYTKLCLYIYVKLHGTLLDIVRSKEWITTTDRTHIFIYVCVCIYMCVFTTRIASFIYIKIFIEYVYLLKSQLVAEFTIFNIFNTFFLACRIVQLPAYTA